MLCSTCEKVASCATNCGRIHRLGRILVLELGDQQLEEGVVVERADRRAGGSWSSALGCRRVRWIGCRPSRFLSLGGRLALLRASEDRRFGGEQARGSCACASKTRSSLDQPPAAFSPAMTSSLENDASADRNRSLEQRAKRRRFAGPSGSPAARNRAGAAASSSRPPGGRAPRAGKPRRSGARAPPCGRRASPRR